MSVAKSRQVMRASPASFQVSVFTGSHDLWTFSDSHLSLSVFLSFFFLFLITSFSQEQNTASTVLKIEFVLSN